MANVPQLGLFDSTNGLVLVVADNFDFLPKWTKIHTWSSNDPYTSWTA